MHDDDRPQSVAELLDLLHPRGIYSVALLEREFVRFGFSYDRGTDRLAYRGRAEPVSSRPTDDFVREQVGHRNLVMDEDKPDDDWALDAVELSDIVFRLLFPGRVAPGRLHADRDDAYAANLAAIQAGLTTGPWRVSGRRPVDVAVAAERLIH